MAKNKKRKLLKKSEETTKTKPNKKKLEKAPAIVEEEDSDGDSSEPESDPEKIQKLLEPYTKSQLIEYICDAAIKDSSLYERILNTADRDVSHRKIFVHGLSWDTTRENLNSVFESFGQIEDCNVIMDRVTGKAKGYGFVQFKTRAGAAKALKLPQKKINNRLTNCQLASTGGFSQQNFDTTGRKIYVSNVHSDIDAERLRVFFAKFGEIETGPLGFDLHTGKSRGFALFVYRTQEGANKVLEEPYKLFEGHQLHCQLAIENKNKPVVQPVQPPVLAAVAAAQNLAMFSQHPGFNPAYGAFLANPNAGMIAGSVNPMMAGALNHPGMIPSHQMPGNSMGNSMGNTAGIGGYGGSHGLGNFGGNPSLLGPYGPTAPAMQGPPQYYQNPHHLGPSPSARPHPAGGSFNGFPSYMCP